MPVNHMVVVTDEVARAKPQAVAELYRLLEASRAAAGMPAAGEPDPAPFGRASEPALPRTAGQLRRPAGAHPAQTRL